MAVMKLVGRISMQIDVESFIEAGAHEAKLGELLDYVRQRYPDAELELTQRRDRPPLDIKTVQRASPPEGYRERPSR